METVLNLLLLRFALMAGALVLVALVGFAIALRLRRQGRLDEARRRAAPVVDAVVRAAVNRYLGRRP